MCGIIIICVVVVVLINSCATGNFQPLSKEYLIPINVITFIAYGWDKLAAINRWWRIMEFTLHVLSLMGGWPAAFVAQHLFGHKTSKIRFQIIFWLIVVVHAIVIIYALLH